MLEEPAWPISYARPAPAPPYFLALSSPLTIHMHSLPTHVYTMRPCTWCPFHFHSQPLTPHLTCIRGPFNISVPVLLCTCKAEKQHTSGTHCLNPCMLIISTACSNSCVKAADVQRTKICALPALTLPGALLVVPHGAAERADDGRTKAIDLEPRGKGRGENLSPRLLCRCLMHQCAAAQHAACPNTATHRARCPVFSHLADVLAPAWAVLAPVRDGCKLLMMLSLAHWDERGLEWRESDQAKLICCYL